jgi:hypothetical protein
VFAPGWGTRYYFKIGKSFGADKIRKTDFMDK